jgi:uroporphyrinogen decarboxylase
MPKYHFQDIQPDWQGLVNCILRRETPERVYHVELLFDPEVQDAIMRRSGLLDNGEPEDAMFPLQREMAVRQFLGQDFVRCGLDDVTMVFHRSTAEDTSALQRNAGRTFVDSGTGPVTTWEEFERYEWPDPDKAGTQSLEWMSNNLPENMCLATTGFGHFAEHLTWLMGFEHMCMSLYDNRSLVGAVCEKLLDINTRMLKRLLTFDSVRLIWASDDMGFRTGTMISPDDLREFILPAHKRMAQMAHEAGRPYILHSCGNLRQIMDDLIDDVQIDAKHSFEDTIESVVDMKRCYGDRVALLGGIDMDFLCRSDHAAIRRRVRETLDACQPGGGYCLGTGNSVANYIPLDSYLTMVDEGMHYGAQ